MYKIVYLPNFPENPSNPARANLVTNVIEINLFAWQFLSPKQREFILLHECGHLKKKTFDESIADNYALDNMKFDKEYTLYDFVKTVRMVAKDDPNRERKAEIMCLERESKKGNKKAKKLLKTYNYE